MATQTELALAVAAGPLSLDQLLEWGLGRPVELWRLLDEGRQGGWVEEDSSAGPGHFVLTDPARRVQILEEASFEGLVALVQHLPLASGMLEAAHALRKEHRYAAATQLLRALITTLPPEQFPQGERSYAAAVLATVRIFRKMYGVPGEVVERAIRIAEAQGDSGTQAVLLAAQGLCALQEGRLAEADALYQRAREGVQSAPAEFRLEVYTYVAVGLVWQGRLREGIAAFEEMLGDVPDAIISNGIEWTLDDSANAAAPFAHLAVAYGYTGQMARALEVLHRLLAQGEKIGRPVVTVTAEMMLGLVLASDGDLAARPHAERAWHLIREMRGEPLYVYMSALAMAWVLAAEGRVDEMREVFRIGLEARSRGGRPPLAGLIPFHIEERLGPDAFQGIEGFDLHEEAQRCVRFPNGFVAGIAHRYLARRLGRGPADAERDRRIAEHLEKAVALLREAGALPELARALADAAAHAERTGEVERAQALCEERRRVRNALPRETTDDASRRAQLASVILALGKLAPLRSRQEGFWGEIASRLSRGLGAERVALLALRDPPELLAARGGDTAWHQEVLELARSAPTAVAFAQLGRRTRVVIPFCEEGLARRGLAVLENEHTALGVGEKDGPLLAGLGDQLGVLFGNLLLWRELASARERLEQENRYFREARPGASTSSRMIAHSEAMRRVLDLVARVAPTPTSVLVLGETGVGKELIAHEVHRQSARRAGPFIAVHIASLAPGLIASGLFGHERGAFTGATEQAKGRFELADGGTIFLDEIGELSPEDQVRLLRVLQEGTFERVGGTRPIRSDFRLVAATNRDLEKEVKAGRFREDLFFRLNVFPIRVPPLRERREEIATLALYFMERAARNVGRSFEGISEADVERMTAYPWPGNVRELEHLVERAVLLSDGPRLRIPPLDGAIGAPQAESDRASRPTLVSLREAERRHIARVLEHTHGRITGAGGAAEILELKPSTLNWKIKDLGLKDALAAARRGRPA